MKLYSNKYVQITNIQHKDCFYRCSYISKRTSYNDYKKRENINKHH